MESWLGKPVAENVYKKIEEGVAIVRAKKGRPPGLGLLLVGENPSSQVYVNMKGKACEKYGLYSKTITLPTTASFNDVSNAVTELNTNPEIDGFIIQLPLPSHLPERTLLDLVDAEKDADCLAASNIGRLVLGVPEFLPCTPSGIMEMLEYYKAPVSGKHVLVIGRSQIVGRPISILLSLKGVDATVTLAHSRTKNLNELLKSADGIVAAIGVPGFIKASDCKAGSWIVDVGVNRVPADNEKGYKLVGDVLCDSTDHLHAMTPVPGGVGPMTIAQLLSNCVKAALV